MGGLQIKCVAASASVQESHREARGCAVALTGAECGAVVRRAAKGGEAEPLAVNSSAVLQRGDVLELGYASDGSRAYVCVEGGIDVAPILGSRSTDLRAALGGHCGRALREGDQLGVAAALPSDTPAPSLLRALHDPLRDPGGRGPRAGGGKRVWELRVLPGPGDPAGDPGTAPGAEPLAAAHGGGASDSSSESEEGDTLFGGLLGAEFNVLPRSDRMAVCVSTSERTLTGGEQMSEACVSGTVQLPPDGNPVILLAEHQTTGGYRVPAIVAQVDLWKVGQMRPGDTMRFVATTEGDSLSLPLLFCVVFSSVWFGLFVCLFAHYALLALRFLCLCPKMTRTPRFIASCSARRRRKGVPLTIGKSTSPCSPGLPTRWQWPTWRRRQRRRHRRLR